jgi:hypothetical protein
MCLDPADEWAEAAIGPVACGVDTGIAWGPVRSGGHMYIQANM